MRFDRPEACQKCGQCDGGKHATILELSGRADPGDRVEVQMPEGRVAQAALLAYAMPLVFMLAGLLLSGSLRTALGVQMGENGFAALCSGVGLLIALIPLGVMGRAGRLKNHFTPRIVAVMPAQAEDETSETKE